MSKKTVSLFAAAAIFAAVFSGCQNMPITRTFFAMDTVMSISAEADEQTLDEAVDIINSLSSELSARSKSELTDLNEKKQSSAFSNNALQAIKLAKSFSQLTDNSYCAAIGGASLLWNFEKKTVPNVEATNAVIYTLDYNNIIISDEGVTLLNGAKIDLGGMLKGFAANLVKDLFLEKGIKNAVINLGGNVYVLGEKQAVGIKKPYSDDVAVTVRVKDLSVVTAGSYERSFVADGQTYHHILDAKTGRPAKSNLLSVTVIGEDSAFCDAVSTAMFVMGKEKAQNFALQHDIAAVFIDEKSNISYSDRILNKKDGERLIVDM